MTLSTIFTEFIGLSVDIIGLIIGIMRMSFCFDVSLSNNDTEHFHRDEYNNGEHYYAECHYAVRLYAEYHYVEGHKAIYCYAEYICAMFS